MIVLRIQNTDHEDLDDTTPLAFEARGYSWTARIIADVPFYAIVGAVGINATADDAYFNEFEENLLSVGAEEDLSILGSDSGEVWVSEVLASS